MSSFDTEAEHVPRVRQNGGELPKGVTSDSEPVLQQLDRILASRFFTLVARASKLLDAPPHRAGVEVPELPDRNVAQSA
jgi:hypothetical protein